MWSAKVFSVKQDGINTRILIAYDNSLNPLLSFTEEVVVANESATQDTIQSLSKIKVDSLNKVNSSPIVVGPETWRYHDWVPVAKYPIL